MTRSNADFMFGACIAALGGLMVLLPTVFRSTFDPYGGVVLSANMRMLGGVIGFVGLAMLVHALLTRFEAEPATARRVSPPGGHPF